MQLLAQVSGDSLVRTLVWIICIGVVFWLLHWLIGYVGIPEPFNKVARIILAVVGVLILINVLLSLAGHPIVRW